MYKDLLKINYGFINRDSYAINSALLSYLRGNKEKVIFQRHPLGFKYFKMGNISSTLEFRLHFWINTNENQDDDLQIHDHSFNFESFVIYGTLRNTKFVTAKKINCKGYIYNVIFENEKSNLVLNSKQQILEKINSEVIRTGGFYYMKSNELHKSENLNGLSISLLKIIKPKDKIARVYSPKKLNGIPSFERTLISQEENSKLLNRLIDSIKKR